MLQSRIFNIANMSFYAIRENKILSFFFFNLAYSKARYLYDLLNIDNNHFDPGVHFFAFGLDSIKIIWNEGERTCKLEKSRLSFTASVYEN